MISSSSVSGVAYYLGSGGAAKGRESYYTDAVVAGEPAGFWSGRLAAYLGLVGEVDASDMEQIYGTFVAPDGTKLGRPPMQFASFNDRVEAALQKEPGALPERQKEIEAEIARSSRSAVLGMDLTFGVPKTVSIAHTAVWRAETEATRSGQLDRAAEFKLIRLEIEDAIHAANAAALEFASTVTMSRTGSHGSGPGKGTWIAAPDLVTASFFQHTSRSVDPQLHIHNVVLNRARGADGQIRGLDMIDIVKQRLAVSAIADRVLAEELGNRGINMEMRPDGISREIVGIDQELIELFSTRRRTITARVAPIIAAAEEKLGRELTDLELSRLHRQVSLSSRPGKRHDGESWDEMLDRWQQAMRDELGAGLVPAAERIRLAYERGPIQRELEFSPSAVIAEAVQAVAAKNAGWSKAALMFEIEQRMPLLGLSTEDTVRAVTRLTEQAMVEAEVQQISGKEGTPAPKV